MPKQRDSGREGSIRTELSLPNDHFGFQSQLLCAREVPTHLNIATPFAVSLFYEGVTSYNNKITCVLSG